MKTSTVKSIKYIGKKPTLDIEIDHPSHVFYANNIATSNSHAVSYALNSYLSAYAKTHFPREFFTSSLYYSKNSPKPHDRVRELVADARYFDIDIRPPLLSNLNKNFQLIGEKIYFGITNIKGVGDSVYKKMTRAIQSVEKELDKKCSDLDWMELLILVLPRLTSSAVKALIDVGGLSSLKMDRKRLKYEYEKYSLLSDREQKWVKKNYATYKWQTLSECIDTIVHQPTGKNGACANKKRHTLMGEIISSLSKPPYSLVDTEVFLAESEESLLGLPITCTSVESCDTDSANCNCKEFLNGLPQNLFFIASQIDRKHEITTKNNKKMCFLSCSDISGVIDSVVVFPEEYKKLRVLLFEKNNIMLVGKRGKDHGSLIVSKIYQL